MHKRAAERPSDGRRFLLGDAGHLSSPLGGEGLNAAFMDPADIAWKLALVVRGAAKPSLLDSYATERGGADHHVLEVSDEVHSLVMDLVAMCDGGGAATLPQGESGAGACGSAQTVDARCFLRGKRAHRSGWDGRRRTITGCSCSRPATASVVRATI